jgi:hypothetical protein
LHRPGEFGYLIVNGWYPSAGACDGELLNRNGGIIQNGDFLCPMNCYPNLNVL